MTFLALRNLFQQKLRLDLSIGGAAFAIGLIVLLNGFREGIFAQATAYLEHTGTDLVVSQEDVTNMLGATAVLPPSAEERARGTPGVARTVPIVTRFIIIDIHGKKVVAYMVGYDPSRGGGPWKLAAGRSLKSNDEVMLDRTMAKTHGFSIGDTIEILDEDLKVVGLSDGTASWMASLLFVQKRAAEGLLLAPDWLSDIEATFAQGHLVPMTEAGERDIACQMQIEPDSLPHLRPHPGEKSAAIQEALQRLLDSPPKPVFSPRWDQEARLWRSQVAPSRELPSEIREVFERTGSGCLAAETNIGVVHICHAADADIASFPNKPVLYRWQLIEMPTAPLIRLELVILDRPANPYLFESFMNVAADDQARILAELANQDRLYLAFYGDDLTHRFTKILRHDEQQWQYLDELAIEAGRYWDSIPPERRDFDRAKAEFIGRSVQSL